MEEEGEETEGEEEVAEGDAEGEEGVVLRMGTLLLLLLLGRD